MVKRLAMLVFVFALVATACTGDDNGDGDGDGNGDGGVTQRDFRFVVVTHGQASDPFWSVAANGVDAAAEDMGVTVEYQAPETFDMVAMSDLIDAAVASQPDGLVVSIPDADALGPSIQAAVDAGIPVISMNSGSDVFEDLGVLVHVGPDRVRGRADRGPAVRRRGRPEPDLHQPGGRERRARRPLRRVLRGTRYRGRGDPGRPERPGRHHRDRGRCPPAERGRRRDPDARAHGRHADARGAGPGGHARRRQVRHVRPVARGAAGDHGRRHAVRDRPGAVPPGLPADRVPHEVPGDRRVAARQRRPGGPHGTADRHCGHRAGRRPYSEDGLR